jgi:hypothetical protein
MSVPNYLSFKDLEGVIGFQSAKENNDVQELERILYEHGADITQPYKIEFVNHRPRTSNIPYEGLRVSYMERLDPSWIASGAASLNAIIESHSDRSLVKELHSLNPEGRGQTSVFENDLEFSTPLPDLEEMITVIEVSNEDDDELNNLSGYTEEDA